MRARRAAERRRRVARTGNIAILVALLLTIIMGFAALSFDIGNIFRVRSELQSAVDAAALAGASALDGTVAATANVTPRAIAFAGMHSEYVSSSLTITGQNVELGHWDPSTQVFGPIALGAITTATSDSVNAVRVSYQEPSVQHPFAALGGNPSGPVGASAIAIAGSPATASCPFPIAIGNCTIDPSAVWCGGCLAMQDATTDNVGWMNFSGGSANPNNTRDAVQVACATIDASGNCVGQSACGTVGAGVSYPVNNGNFFNTSGSGLCSTLLGLLRRTTPPTHFTVTAAVMQTGQTMAACNPKFSSSQPVAGFTAIDVWGVSCGGGAANQAIDPNAPPAALGCNTASSKYMMATVHCGYDPSDVTGGGGFYGVVGQRRLVQ